MLSFTKTNRLLSHLFIIIFLFLSLAAREGEEVVQAKEGNFAVTGTLQPAPFLGFGETIIASYEGLIGAYPNILWGHHSQSASIMPYFLYGLRDDLSLFLAFPTAMSFKYDEFRSSGSQDLIFQLEYAFYQKQLYHATNQFTLVTSVYLPTGDEFKNPATGFGSPSFFVGVTANHLATQWYYYTSYGVLFTTRSENDTKSGNQFLYQAGVGKNIAYKSDKWTLMWLVEMSGLYAQKGTSVRVPNQESSFNMIVVGPSLWFSTNRLLLQFGIAPVAYQRLAEGERKHSFFAGCELAVRFN